MKMKKESASRSAFFNPRVLIGFALCSIGVLVAFAALTKSVAQSTAGKTAAPQAGTWTTTSSMSIGRRYFTATLLTNGKVLVAGGWVPEPTTQTRTLTFADRVAHQHAIEEVYWRHRNWPGADGSSKPSFDQVMSRAQIEKKVDDYLRNSQALEDYWQQPITPKQLQTEMDRMASHTKRPEVLRELFAALGNDPYIIAECLARPALADRLARSLYAYDQRFHGALRQHAQAELAERSIAQMQQTSGQYTEMAWVRADD